MAIYKSFQARNFRCFRDLDLEDLGAVNIVAGVNNVGKTTLLEALFLHCGAYKPELVLALHALRGIAAVKVEPGTAWGSLWDSMFSDFDSKTSIELLAELAGTGKRRVRIRVLRELEELRAFQGMTPTTTTLPPPGPSQPQFTTGAEILEMEYEEGSKKSKHYLILDAAGPRAFPLSPVPAAMAAFVTDRGAFDAQAAAERFGTLQLRGEDQVVVEGLKILEPRLRSLKMLIIAGQPVLHGDLGLKQLVPLPFMGGGMVHLSRMLTEIGYCSGGVALIDEVENGLHHSLLQRVWEVLGHASQKFAVQVFATTHSRECILAAHAAFSAANMPDLRLHRLELTDQGIRAVTYGKNTLGAAIESGLEVR